MYWTVIYADAVLKVMALFHLCFPQPFSEATYKLVFSITLQLGDWVLPGLGLPWFYPPDKPRTPGRQFMQLGRILEYPNPQPLSSIGLMKKLIHKFFVSSSPSTLLPLKPGLSLP